VVEVKLVLGESRSMEKSLLLGKSRSGEAFEVRGNPDLKRYG